MNPTSDYMLVTFELFSYFRLLKGEPRLCALPPTVHKKLKCLKLIGSVYLLVLSQDMWFSHVLFEL